MSRLLHIPSKIAVWVVQTLIRGYQLTISPLLGQCCRFEPSCSTYSQEAFATHGFLKGSWLTVVRVAKCGPFHDGGYDPVPEKGVVKPCIGACHAKPFVAHTKAASKKAKEEGLPEA